PTSELIVAKLTAGACTVSQALDRPWLFAVDQKYDGEITRIQLLVDGLASVPTCHRPVQTALLWPHLEIAKVEASAKASIEHHEIETHVARSVIRLIAGR
ncbi:MAG TPA: hypothetical protein VL424_01130, partial [Pararobbsia sp.]|nr:hypothetical protein [Pararobbsia sp.]